MRFAKAVPQPPPNQESRAQFIKRCRIHRNPDRLQSMRKRHSPWPEREPKHVNGLDFDPVATVAREKAPNAPDSVSNRRSGRRKVQNPQAPDFRPHALQNQRRQAENQAAVPGKPRRVPQYAPANSRDTVCMAPCTTRALRSSTPANRSPTASPKWAPRSPATSTAKSSSWSACSRARPFFLVRPRPRHPGRRHLRLRRRLQLRQGPALLRRRQAHQGPRRAHRGQERPHRRRHSRHRPHPRLPAQALPPAPPQDAAHRRPARQALAPHRKNRGRLRRLLHPQPLRHRLRHGLRRALPQPPRHLSHARRPPSANPTWTLITGPSTPRRLPPAPSPVGSRWPRHRPHSAQARRHAPAGGKPLRRGHPLPLCLRHGQPRLGLHRGLRAPAPEFPSALSSAFPRRVAGLHLAPGGRRAHPPRRPRAGTWSCPSASSRAATTAPSTTPSTPPPPSPIITARCSRSSGNLPAHHGRKAARSEGCRRYHSLRAGANPCLPIPHLRSEHPSPRRRLPPRRPCQPPMAGSS
jgi:hypothetical protein